MNIETLIKELSLAPVPFNTVMAVIDEHYHFTPTGFRNGELLNEANQNNGSCKIFAFAKLNQLNQQATLNAFGDFYRVDVLQHPNNEDHQNIRNFMKYGWDAIEFKSTALEFR